MWMHSSGMTLPRSFLVPEEASGCYHVISRCVRRAFLCGDQAAHRQEWLTGIIRDAAGAFAVEVMAYAVMSNHLHIVVQMAPARAAGWTAAEVSHRWHAAHPQLTDEGFRPWPQAVIDARATDEIWCATALKRLKSLSWFMKCIKERLARIANREDDCTGHFWEGRFQCIPLLDAQAVVACMAYVDLNPVRAGIVTRPEDAPHTSIHDRCAARQRHAQATLLVTHGPADHPDRAAALAVATAGSQAGLWIAPLPEDRRTDGFPMTRDEYLALVDATGRVVRADKRGAIPSNLSAILDRLDLDAQGWLAVMHGGGALSRGSAIGSTAARTAESIRRNAAWIVNACAGLYRKVATSGHSCPA
jgi:REP element-mobilizing transposase RayT